MTDRTCQEPRDFDKVRQDRANQIPLRPTLGKLRAHHDVFEIAGTGGRFHRLRQVGERMEARLDRVEVERAAPQQVEQAPAGACRIHELAENLPAVQLINVYLSWPAA